MLPRQLASNHRFWLLLAVLTTLVISATQWLVFYPDNASSDFTFYSIAGQLFTEQFWQGDLYPRFLHEANAGAGSPVFWIYGPLPFYAHVALSSFIPDGNSGLHIFNATCALAMLAAVLGCYLWLAEIIGKPKAAFGAFMFALAPYRLLLLFVQFNIGTLTAIACVMFVMFFAEKCCQRKGAGWVGFMISYALLLLSHPPGFIVLGWLPLAYMAIRSFKQPDAKRLWIGIVASVCVALALSCFYWLPAVMAKPLLNVDNILRDGYNFKRFFDTPFVYWMLPTLAMSLVVAYLYIKPENGWRTCLTSPFTALESSTILLLVSTLLTLFLVLPISWWLWENLPILPYVQLPFRFLVIGVAWFGLVSALLLSYPKLNILWCSITALMCAFFLYNALTVTANLRSPDALLVRQHHMIVPYGREYQPPHVSDEYYNQRAIAAMAKQADAVVVRGAADVSLVRTGIDTWQLEADVRSEDAVITLRKYAFPTVQLRNHENGSKLMLTPSEQGLASVTLPAGKHTLTLSYSPLPLESLAKLISLFGLVLISGFFMLRRNRRLALRSDG